MIQCAARACSALLLLLVLPTMAAAQAEDQRAFLDLTINGVAGGDALVILRMPDVLVQVATLRTGGMTQVAGRRETLDGQEFVSLRSLAPAVTFVFDEQTLRLTITADPALLGTTVYDLRGDQPADLEYRRSRSGFLNYALNAGTASSQDYEAFTEAAYSHHAALIYNTASWSPRGLVRGVSSVTLDQRQQLRRWTAGDTFAGGDVLGGDALLTGISVAREFSLAPYFVRYPSLSLSTPVATPSVVEVYVNGRLVRSEAVQPGRLDLRNLPLTTGSNDTRVVVRDPFGSTREVSGGYYMTTSVLARGLQDYRYSAGVRRLSYGTRNWDYGKPAILARHRVGLTNGFTLGGRFEAEGHIVSGGPAANIRLPIGEVELAAGMSRDRGALGLAAQGAYAYTGKAVSVGASLRQAGDAYATIGGASADSQPRRQLDIFAALPMKGAASLAVQQSYSRGLDRPAQRRTSLVGSFRIGQFTNVVATAAHFAEIARDGYELSAGMTISLGARTTATVSTLRDAQGTHAALDLQRPLPVGNGAGYQLRTEGGVQDTMSGVVQYQGTYGRYEFRREALGAARHSAVSVSGALVGIGGSLYATRPVRNSYALIKVPDVQGVRAFSSNQEIGRTGRGGNLLVPDLLPYYGNQLSIADGDIPIDYLVPDVNVTLAPPYRGGAVVLFPVQRVQRATGTILVTKDGVDTIPIYGQIVVTSGVQRYESPVGGEGEFYFENLPAGRHTATVTWGGGACAFSMLVPAATDAVVTLGALRCTAATEAP